MTSPLSLLVPSEDDFSNSVLEVQQQYSYFSTLRREEPQLLGFMSPKAARLQRQMQMQMQMRLEPPLVPGGVRDVVVSVVRYG